MVFLLGTLTYTVRVYDSHWSDKPHCAIERSLTRYARLLCKQKLWGGSITAVSLWLYHLQRSRFNFYHLVKHSPS